MTINAVKKKIDAVYDQLTPKERAQLVSSGYWSIARASARGEDTAELEQEQIRFIDKYVYSLSTIQYIDYLVELSELEVSEWGRQHFAEVLYGLRREDALISLLLIEKHRTWCTKMAMKEKVKETPEWKEQMAKDEKNIRMLRERKRSITKQAQEILSADFWDDRKIERPPDLMFGDESILELFDDIEGQFSGVDPE